MTTASWLDGMKGASVVEVARALGMEGDAKRGLYGCPCCGAEKRHPRTNDKRGALLIAGAGAGWRCVQCDASGDALNLISYRLHDCKISELGDGHARTEVREWCETYNGTEARAARPVVEAIVEKPYPPADEIAALWAACRRVDESDSATAWCKARGLDVGAIATIDVARALPSGDAGPLPEWAMFGKSSWRAGGYHLIVPLYDAEGAMRSVIARCVVEPRKFPSGDSAPKSVPPRGFKRSGLVMACPWALDMLRDGTVAEGREVWITEGEGDYLRLASGGQLSPHDAVLGIFSGSVKPELIARIPAGAQVVIATDDDAPGEKYATQIAKLIAKGPHPEIVIGRWRPRA